MQVPHSYIIRLTGDFNSINNTSKVAVIAKGLKYRKIHNLKGKKPNGPMNTSANIIYL